MSTRLPTASAVVILAGMVFAPACAKAVRSTATQPLGAQVIAELWQAPADISDRDLFHGPGGARLAPRDGSAFTFVSADSGGYSAGYDVKDSTGRTWSVKLGPEAQTEVVSSRVLWAIGYHQPPTYYVSSWTLSGGPGGAQQAGRFRPEMPGAEIVGDWSWSENQFVGTRQFNGLIVANLLLNSWDWKTSNNKIYRHSDGSGPATRYVVRDLGASLGKTSFPRFLKWLPVRGFGQGSRNDIDDFERQGFIKSFDENRVRFDYRGIYGHVVDQVRPADVRWTAELLAEITDAQWDAAFRAADYPEEVRARYIRKIKAKIAEGLAVS